MTKYAEEKVRQLEGGEHGVSCLTTFSTANTMGLERW
jgi:hypothetical protein